MAENKEGSHKEGRAVILTDAGRLVDFLEKYIPVHGNPSTPEEWSKCMAAMMAEEGAVDAVMPVENNVTASDIYRGMKKQGFDVDYL